MLAPLSSFAQAPAPTPARVVAASPANPNDPVKLQFPNSDVADVLRYYEVLTGKRVVADNAVQGKVNIFITPDPPRDEAIKIIEINLLMNGYSLVPAEPDIVKVFATGKNPRSAGIPIVSDPADIPPGDHVISYLYKLRYADPQELQTVLQQYLSGGQGNVYSSVQALTKSSSILITENSSTVRAIKKIVDQVDVEPAQVESVFIPLERADATKVVEMLKDIFEKGNDQPTRGGVVTPNIRTVRNVPNVPGQPQPEYDIGALSGLSEDSIIVGKIKIAADVRTNRIHVITRPVNLPFIRKLIAEFDANVQFAKPITRALRYISAGDVLPVLVQALTEPGENQQQGAGGAAGPQAGATPPRNANPATANSFNAGQAATASGSELNISEELSTQPVDTAPKAVTVGNSKLIADQRSNSIIVLGNREVVVKVEKILDQMDVKAPQVVLSTVIGELTLNNNEEFGVDYFVKFKRFKSPGSNSGAAGESVNLPSGTGFPSILDPSQITSITQLASSMAGGANLYLAAGNTLSAIVHALDSTGRFRTISRPTVFTSNNKKAIIASGTEIPVPVNSITSPVGVVTATPVPGTTGTNLPFATSSNIQFKKVALQLEVVPLINSEKEVSLDILQKIDSLAGTTRIDNNDIPNIATRYIRTNVSAPNCSTIILGGLITEDKRKSKSGIPILDRLPLVGALFRNTTDARTRTELIVLMRPEVTLTKLDLYRLRNKGENRTHFGPELEQDDCPDCPKPGDGKQLPPPDVPMAKDS